MAFYFEQERFVEDLLEKAKKQGLYEEAIFEIDAFRSKGQLEYLFIIGEFTKAMEREGLLPLTLRRSGGASVLAYLLGMNKVNPKEYGLSNRYFAKQESIRFEICLPSNQKKAALDILTSMTEIQEDAHGRVTFGRCGYQVSLLAHPALGRIEELERMTGVRYKGIPLDEEGILAYMFEPYDGGYWMPNLKGCYVSSLKGFYEAFKAVDCKKLPGLARLHALFNGAVKDEEWFSDSLRQNGLDMRIVGKDQLYGLLVETYDFREEDAWQIAEDVASGKELVEWETLLLESKEVPQPIIDQFGNIRYLHYHAYGAQSSYLSYLLAYYKFHFKDAFLSLLPKLPFTSCVGPFFYVDGQIKAHKEPLSRFDPNIRFLDSGMSHFEFFDSLGIDGDYGNYPRGRVLYDNLEHRFLIYIDKALDKKSIKERIKGEFECGDEGVEVEFRRDSHYVHDGL